MSEDISCEVLRITWPDWSSVSDELKESIWQVLSQRVEDGEAPSRRGFVGTTRFEDIIAGFFAHEDRRLGVQYDDDWNKEDREAAEFEHLFFALVLSQGQVILQRKRIGREFLSLNMPTMRREFFDLLGRVLLRAGFPSDHITREPFHEERQKDYLIQIFNTYPSTLIRVSNLLGRKVPEDVRLFNPDIDKDLILKQVLNGDYQHVDELEARAGEEEGSSLRNAMSIRAAMLAGEPKEVRAIVEAQERTFRKTQHERFTMQLGTEAGEQLKETDLDRVVRIIRTEYFIPEQLVRPPVSLGPLFEWAKRKG